MPTAFILAPSTVSKAIVSSLFVADSGVGHEKHHHYIPADWLPNRRRQSRLTARGEVVAELFEEEQSGQPLDGAHQ